MNSTDYGRFVYYQSAIGVEVFKNIPSVANVEVRKHKSLKYFCVTSEPKLSLIVIFSGLGIDLVPWMRYVNLVGRLDLPLSKVLITGFH